MARGCAVLQVTELRMCTGCDPRGVRELGLLGGFADCTLVPIPEEGRTNQIATNAHNSLLLKLPLTRAVIAGNQVCVESPRTIESSGAKVIAFWALRVS